MQECHDVNLTAMSVRCYNEDVTPHEQIESVPGIDSMEIVGGRLALIFVNTANWVDGTAVDDRLSDAESVIRWARRAGLTIPATSGFALGDVCVVDIRERVRVILDPNEASVNDAAEIRSMIDKIDTPENGDIGSDCRFVLSAVLFSAIEIISEGVRDRVRQCPGPRCGWMFLDTSPGKRRRWCSMNSCGNRAKVQRHYQQAKSGKSPSPHPLPPAKL